MYSMKETCLKTGMSYETLKYYCNEGLIPNVERDGNNYRIFDERNIAWINNLSCLKKCGMGISEMKTYVAYCLEGESSIPTRKVMLERKKQVLLDKLHEMNECIEFIDSKQQFYDDVLSKKIKYQSNLIRVDKK